MKKKIGISIITALCLSGVCMKTMQNMHNTRAELVQASALEQEKGENHLNIRAKSAYAMDFASGTPIYSIAETTRLPIASMCKIMTLILAFDAIDNGVMTMDDEIIISEHAASMGGSQVFLEAHAKYPVRELIKSIVVCSANDSCVALAEKISGSESGFVAEMNEKAKFLGANDTLFANCTGLPQEPQYSCAKDVAIMLKELLKHEEYYAFGNVWMDKFIHPQGRYTEISNTNKLVRFYEGCDGGKTGFTNQAGFCLAATAKRGDMRVISVVIGEKTSANRFEDVRAMFDYAFANYTATPIVQANIALSQTATVSAGKIKEANVCPIRSSFAFQKRGEHSDYKLETILYPLRAPVEKGEPAGEIIVYKDNVEVDKIPLITMERIEKATFFERLQDVAESWNTRK